MNTFPYSKFSVGFDDIWNQLDQLANRSMDSYPPYNIAKVDDNQYIIELAVAGFSQEEINVQQQENFLTIKGEKLSKDKPKYLHMGISSRSFVRTFKLSDTVEVVNASLTDGILRVQLENKIPEDKKPRLIPVSGPSSKKAIRA